MTDTLISEPGKVIAFYSFKGGTGRSMALANVACILARGQEASSSVLMIDWDLEAPGLHRYFRNHLYGAFHGVGEAQDEHPGVIDLFIELREKAGELQSGRPSDLDTATNILREVPIDEYIIETDISNLYIIKAG